MPLPPTQANYWPQQSPIDLYKRESFFVKVPQSYFKWKYRDAPYPGTFEGEPGHRNFVLKLPKSSRPPMIRLGHARAELKKIHLHMPSEHDLNGKDHQGEIHLIHEVQAPTNGSDLIVLGVFFELHDAAKDHTIISLDAHGADIHGTSDENPCHDTLVFAIDPGKLMPNTNRWFRYEGSLTSKPYSEIVSWLVFVEPLAVSAQNLALLKKYADQPERETQPINRRFILRNFV